MEQKLLTKVQSIQDRFIEITDKHQQKVQSAVTKIDQQILGFESDKHAADLKTQLLEQ